MKATIKRVYEAVDQTGGTRILVDRLWPRGISKKAAMIDVWLKEIAPSTELRKWFDHDPEKLEIFAKKYNLELKQNPSPVNELKQYMKKGKVTLLYGAKDPACNHALVLQTFMLKHK